MYALVSRKCTDRADTLSWEPLEGRPPRRIPPEFRSTYPRKVREREREAYQSIRRAIARSCVRSIDRTIVRRIRSTGRYARSALDRLSLPTPYPPLADNRIHSQRRERARARGSPAVMKSSKRRVDNPARRSRLRASMVVVYSACIRVRRAYACAFYARPAHTARERTRASARELTRRFHLSLSPGVEVPRGPMQRRPLWPH